MIDKVCSSVAEALDGLEPGMEVAVGGFGVCGSPSTLIDGIVEKGVGDLTVYSNNPGTEMSNPGTIYDGAVMGLSRPIAAGLVKRFCGSYIGMAKSLERQFFGGEMEVELMPQGSLVERMRCGGAGIPAFWTPSGAGTPVSDGGLPMRHDKNGKVVKVSEPKETRTFIIDGREELCVLEPAITPDFSLVRAWKGDREGNLVFHLAAENLNPVVGMCGRVTVAEVEELVDVGELAPGEIQLQGIFVDRLVVVPPQDVAEKPIERLVTRSANPDDHAAQRPVIAFDEQGLPHGWTRAGIAARAAQELEPDSYVNLGIGLPTQLPDFLPEGLEVVFHSENGLLKVGPSPLPEEVDADLINAGKATVTLAKGGSSFDSMRSFDMIRGKHIDTAVLGALQVSERGDIANWIVPGKKSSGMGGAMDLVKGARRVIAIMEHVNNDGDPRVLTECTYPLTALAAVDLVITNLGVFQVADDGFELLELAPGVSLDEVRSTTEAHFGTSHLAS